MNHALTYSAIWIPRMLGGMAGYHSGKGGLEWGYLADEQLSRRIQVEWVKRRETDLDCHK